MMRVLICLISLMLGASSAWAEPLAKLYWYGVPEAADRAFHQKVWAQYAIEVQYCDATLSDCIRSAAEQYLVLMPQKSAQLADVYQNAESESLRGVISLGTRKDMPVRARPATIKPKLLALVEHNELRDAVVRLRRLTSNLRNKGVDSTLIFVPSDTLNRLEMPVPNTSTIRFFLGDALPSDKLPVLLQAHFNWQNPRWNNDEYRSQFKYLTREQPTAYTRSMFEFFYAREPYLLKQWNLDRFTGFDLLAYRNDVAPNARYVKLANRRGQFYFLDLEKYAHYEPYIIIGVDDETNMYRLTWFYRTHKMYSWDSAVQQASARPLGPLLAFRQTPPEELAIPLLLRSAIPLDGITFLDEDPLAEIAKLPGSLQRVLKEDNRCVYCHAVGSIDPRAYHIDAMTLEPQGGFALPLKDYSDDALRAFLFDQERIAATIGMTPNPVDANHVNEFYEWVQSLR